MARSATHGARRDTTVWVQFAGSTARGSLGTMEPSATSLPRMVVALDPSIGAKTANGMAFCGTRNAMTISIMWAAASALLTAQVA